MHTAVSLTMDRKHESYPKHRNTTPGTILRPSGGIRVFFVVLLIFYGIVPFYIWTSAEHDANEFLLLSGLCAVAVGAMYLGFSVKLFDSHLLRGPKIALSGRGVVTFVFLTFISFSIYTWVTAPSIPLIDALTGSGAELLSAARGDFLKARTGVEAALIYVMTILTSTFVPYALIAAFHSKYRLRIVYFGFFFLYCVSFLAKSLFLNALAPLVVYMAITGKITRRALFWSATVVFSLLLAFMGTAIDDTVEAREGAPFFSATYYPKDPLDFLLWRALAVPVFTASDTVLVFSEKFHNQYLLGSTSSLISEIFGFERINIERHVFEYQFGGWNDVANANSVFFVDGYVNFGLLGVIVYGLISGILLRILVVTKDISAASIWPIFAISLFWGSLLGTILSNGWIIFFLYLLLVKIRPRRVVENV